jgi:hypothetical protein
MLAIMPYPGGKGGDGVFQTIINRMPPHRVYAEPFLAGCGKSPDFGKTITKRLKIGILST